MKKTEQMILAMIQAQENILGPMAWFEASQVKGLVVEKNSLKEVKGSIHAIADALLKRYETIFGQASVDACLDAIQGFAMDLNPSDLPTQLQTKFSRSV